MKMVHEIYESMMSRNLSALLSGDEIEREESAWLAMLRKYVPQEVQDDFAAAVSNYAMACNAKGYEDGFLTAWHLVSEMNEATRPK